MSAWGATGAWATQADEEEKTESFQAAQAFPGLGQPMRRKTDDDDELFPSLGAAKAPKAKAKKGQKMSLADFTAASGPGGGGGSYRPPGGGGIGYGRSNDIDLSQLPSGPAMRDPDEDDGLARKPGQLGGAFKDYGGDRGRGDRYGDRDRSPPRRGGFGDRDRSPPRRGGFGDRDDRRDFDPRDDRDRSPPRSRADDDNNWGASKRAMSPPRDRGDRYGRRSPPRGGRGGRFDSRSPPRRGGFDDRDFDRDRRRPPSRSPSPERDWGALKNRAGPPRRSPSPDRRRSPSPVRDWGALKNRPGPPPRDDRSPPRRGPPPGSRADEAGDRWGKKAAMSPPRERHPREGGSERPRLQLKARSANAPAGGAGGGGSALFGGARPREEALREAGRDWRKEDAALSRGSVNRKASAEETAAKEAIAALEAKLAAAGDEEEKKALSEEMAEKEAALLKLSAELDDKVRFSQRNGGDREKRGGERDRRGEGEEGSEERRGGRGGRVGAGAPERERDFDRGWGEGKEERQAANRGKGGSDGGSAKKERAPREPRAVKLEQKEEVKVAASAFAALAVDDDN